MTLYKKFCKNVTACPFSTNHSAAITMLYWSLRKSEKFSLMVSKIFSLYKEVILGGCILNICKARFSKLEVHVMLS